MLIVLEGIDGCGKTTVARRLSTYLRNLNFDVVESKEPGFTPLGLAVRKIIMDPDTGTKTLAPGVVDLLFLAAHIQNWKTNIEPALLAKKVVISDRWWYSQEAYSLEREVPDPVREVYRRTSGQKADLLILLHGDVKSLVDRARGRFSESHQETKAWNDYDVLAKVQRNYILQNRLRDEFMQVCVDGKDQDQVFLEVLKLVSPKLQQFHARHEA